MKNKTKNKVPSQYVYYEWPVRIIVKSADSKDYLGSNPSFTTY